jgi:hypothetical protein
VALVIGIAVLAPPLAAAQQPKAAPSDRPAPPGVETNSPDYNGLDYTRPQSNAELRLQYRTSSTPTSEIDQERGYLKLATKVQLPDDWRLGLQTQLPLIDKTTRPTNKPDVDREAGAGDAFAQIVLSRSIDARWAYGFGARLEAPTAQDGLGTGKWQIMPGFGVRYSFVEFGPETYFVPSMRYALSFAGDPSRRSISEPQIAPTLNIGLPNRWFVTFFPSNDIRINYGDPIAGQTGRLFLPFDAAVGRKVADKLTVSLEVSVPIVKDYPVYNFKSELRLSVQF